MNTYLINLDRSTDRLETIKNSLDSHFIEFERVSAVDAQLLTEEELYQNVRTPNCNYPRSLTKGEVACFLSHRVCWEKLVKSGHERALILEDNCEFSPVANQYLASENWIPASCELIHFSYGNNPMFFTDEISLPNNSLIKTKYSAPIGTSAYCISRNAAVVALELSQTIMEPVDNFLFGMFSEFSKRIPCWRTKGCVVRRANVQTVISGRSRGEATLSRNSVLSFHPLRVLKKLYINIQRKQMKSTLQTWIPK